jgi:hypothetical protein
MTLMTENYPPAPPPLPSEPLAPLPPQPQEDQPGTADIVKDQAGDLKDAGIQAGQHAAGVAQEQASDVAAEAARQGRDLLGQAQQQLGDQVAQGQQRLAAQLLSLGDELSSMADGSRQEGTAAHLARQAAVRAQGAAHWLDDRSPRQVIDDVQAFARRRPGAFLALAVGAGLAAGRLTRGLKSAQTDDGTAAGQPRSSSQPDAADAWAVSAAGALAVEDTVAVPAGDAGYAARQIVPSPDVAGAPATQVPAEAGVVAADDGSVVPLVDGLPAADAGSSWDVDPQADELGTLGRHDAGGGLR